MMGHIFPPIQSNFIYTAPVTVNTVSAAVTGNTALDRARPLLLVACWVKNASIASMLS